MKQDRIIAADPEAWIEQTFDCPGVRNGGVFRTTRRAVDAGAGMARFTQELRRRNFRALENKGHIVVFCNAKPVEIIVAGPGNRRC